MPGQYDQRLNSMLVDETSRDEAATPSSTMSTPDDTRDSAVKMEADPPNSANTREPPSTGRDKRVAEGNTSSWTSRILRCTPIGRYLSDGADYEPRPYHLRNPTSQQQSAWVTTVFRFGPLSGIFSMILAVGSLVASLGVLAGSDGQAIESWTAPPSTWIAIFTAIANLSVRYAAIQGVVIAWWTRATRGSTIARLHYDWRAGTTLRGAFTSGRHMGLLGVACIFSSVVVVDGPFLQRSTTVKNAPLLRPVSIDVTMAEEIPHDSTGFWGHGSDYATTWQAKVMQFNHILPTSDPTKFLSNSPITWSNPWMSLNVSGPWYNGDALHGVARSDQCQDVCKATIRAPALAVTACTSYQLPVDYHNLSTYDPIQESKLSAPVMESFAYFTTLAMAMEDDEEWIDLVTGYATTENCQGILNFTACTLKSAIGEYEIHLEGDSLTVPNPESPTIIALANNTTPNHNWSSELGGYPSTLSGIVSMAMNTWYSAVWIEKLPSGDLVPDLIGGTSVMTMQSTDDASCPSYRDPRPNVIAGLNRLMFYTGGMSALKDNIADLEARMDGAPSVRKTVTGSTIGKHPVFHTNYAFFAAAAVIELVCICLIAPTYWGWWKLGRNVSLSPLEMAKAFDAPLLSNCNSNSTGRQMAKDIGDARIQYGLTTDQSMKNRLAFADPGDIRSPQKHTHLDA